MEKLAQQDDSPLLTTPISEEEAVKGIWNKFFADKHNRIISNLRALFDKDPQLKVDLTQMFPGYAWAEFADMPTKNSLQELAAAVERLGDVRRIQMNQDAMSAIQLYMSQYKMLLDRLRSSDKPREKSRAPRSPSPKVKELQQLLGVNPTGLWNEQSNVAFLSWLKQKGWDKNYVKNNKFTGKIDDAINALNIEKAAPDKPAQPAGELASLTQRQTSRLDRLKKLI